MHQSKPLKHHQRPNKQYGLTLVELMVSTVIGLLILSGVFQLYSQSSRLEKVQQGYARVQESARYVFAKLTDDLSRTGYVGCFNVHDGRMNNLLTGTLAGTGNLYDFSEPLVAGNNTGYRSSDILTFRYASIAGKIPLIEVTEAGEDIVVDPDHPNYSQLSQYDVAIVSDCSSATAFMITNDPSSSDGAIQYANDVTSPTGVGNSENNLNADYGQNKNSEGHGGSVAHLYTGTTGAFRYKLDTSQAGIASGGACSPFTSTKWCALYREEQNGLVNEEIAHGVEDFQLEVGWIDASGNVRFGEPLASVDWTAVDRLKLTLTFNSLDEIPTSDGNDLAKRTFSRTVMLRNQFL